MLDRMIDDTEEMTPNSRPDDQRPSVAATTKRQNELSTIGFPYSDLEAASGLARVLWESGGTLTREQLAASMKLQSGTFSSRLSAARMFGFVDTQHQGKVAITELGQAILGGPSQEDAARVCAFLNVPLYRKVYDEFRGKPLPPRPFGLEQVLVAMGVSPKQKSNARAALEKSARQAGFLTADPNRLIEPIIGLKANDMHIGPPTVGMPTLNTTGGLNSALEAMHATPPNVDPLILGLLSHLPKPGERWEAEKRARWLKTLAANMDLIYEDDGGNAVLIECRRQQD